MWDRWSGDLPATVCGCSCVCERDVIQTEERDVNFFLPDSNLHKVLGWNVRNVGGMKVWSCMHAVETKEVSSRAWWSCHEATSFRLTVHPDLSPVQIWEYCSVKMLLEKHGRRVWQIISEPTWISA